MQTTLLGVAIAIILALVAASVAPLVVDWSQYRAAFEEEASRLTGLSVHVNGSIDARHSAVAAFQAARCRRSAPPAASRRSAPALSSSSLGLARSCAAKCGRPKCGSVGAANQCAASMMRARSTGRCRRRRPAPTRRGVSRLTVEDGRVVFVDAGFRRRGSRWRNFPSTATSARCSDRSAAMAHSSPAASFRLSHLRKSHRRRWQSQSAARRRSCRSPADHRDRWRAWFRARRPAIRRHLFAPLVRSAPRFPAASA